jgi:hypothetical protein
MSQVDIDSFVSLVRGKEAAALGPSFYAVNRLNMADMLQAFSQLNDEDRKRFSQAAFDGIPGRGFVGNEKLPQRRQVFLERIEFAYHVVVDRKIPPTIPGDLYETGQLTDAYNFLGTSASQIPSKNVWMTCIGAVCDDAQLRVKGEETVSRSDQTYGQAGWDIGIRYGSGQFSGREISPGVFSSELPKLISKACKPNFIRKLAINAHGDAGEVSVNGVDEHFKAIEPSMKASDTGLTSTFAGVLLFLNRVMTSDGVLFFHGCLSGKGLGGTTLLTRLSFALPGRKIVGFSTLGYTSVEKQRRSTDVCREPGVRDTDDFSEAWSEAEIYNRYFKSGDWDDLSKLPWQSETSPHAKVALNGAIIRGSGL